MVVDLSDHPPVNPVRSKARRDHSIDGAIFKIRITQFVSGRVGFAKMDMCCLHARWDESFVTVEPYNVRLYHSRINLWKPNDIFCDFLSVSQCAFEKFGGAGNIFMYQETTVRAVIPCLDCNDFFHANNC